MRLVVLLALCLGLAGSLLSADETKVVPSKDELFRSVIANVPDYPEFLTVDELYESVLRLGEQHPEIVTVTTLGHTAAGTPIYECRIGHGRNHALLFGFPHPNEPIGSMMLHYLAGELARNEALRDHFDFTWHLVVCAEPDKARLNEGWFKGELSLTRYARHYYRPPSYQQVEWTFPVSYKSYRFDTPTPEARALMEIIDKNPINFSFGLHNSGFGGVYFYWSHDVPELYPRLYDVVAEEGLPLHQGEPEVPWGVKYDDKSMFAMLYFTDDYDYQEAHSPIPPDQVLRSGASSDDYIRAGHRALTVNCELPYFYDPRIEDVGPSDMTRREANLAAIADVRQRYLWTKSRYEKVRPLLTTRSPFVDAIEEGLRTGENDLDTMEDAVRSDPAYERRATNAEKWDALVLRRFYGLLDLGQLVRLLEEEKNSRGTDPPEQLLTLLEEARARFEAGAAEAEASFDYRVIPIRKLVSVQLATALWAMDYVQDSPTFRAPR